MSHHFKLIYTQQLQGGIRISLWPGGPVLSRGSAAASPTTFPRPGGPRARTEKIYGNRSASCAALAAGIGGTFVDGTPQMWENDNA